MGSQGLGGGRFEPPPRFDGFSVDTRSKADRLSIDVRSMFLDYEICSKRFDRHSLDRGSLDSRSRFENCPIAVRRMFDACSIDVQ